MKEYFSLNYRIHKWDNLKALLIFLVVLGHLISPHRLISTKYAILHYFIYFFHMPLFVFINGQFDKNNSFIKIRNRSINLLIIYIFTKLLSYFVDLVTRGSANLELIKMDTWHWYLFTILIFGLVNHALKDKDKRIVFISSIIIACLVGYFDFIESSYSLSRIFFFFPFYYLGSICDPKKLANISNRKNILISILSLLLLMVLLIVFKDKLDLLEYVVKGRFPYSALGAYRKYGMPTRLIYYPLAMGVMFAVIVLIPNGMILGIISKIGRNTLPIYTFHFAVIHLSNRLFGIQEYFTRTLMDKTWIFYLIFSLFIVLILSTSPFSNLVNRLMFVKENNIE